MIGVTGERICSLHPGCRVSNKACSGVNEAEVGGGGAVPSLV